MRDALSSDEFVEAQSGYYHHAIACFGVIGVVESNFPVIDSRLVTALWNG